MKINEIKYRKTSPRLTVQFIDSETEEILFEIKDRTWMNVGEILTDNAVDSIMKVEYKNKPFPQHLMVLVIGEYQLT